MWNLSTKDVQQDLPPALSSDTRCLTCDDELRYYNFPFSAYICGTCEVYWPLQHALEGRPGRCEDSVRCVSDYRGEPNSALSRRCTLRTGHDSLGHVGQDGTQW